MAVRRIITNRAKKSIRNLYWRSTRKSIQRKQETKSLVDAMLELVDATPLVPSSESRGVLGIWKSKGYTIFESTHCFVRYSSGIGYKPIDNKKNLKRKWYFACVVDYRRNTIYIVNAVFAKYIDRLTDNTPTAMRFMSAMKGVITKRNKRDAERRQLALQFSENESKHYKLQKLISECIDRYLRNKLHNKLLYEAKKANANDANFEKWKSVFNVYLSEMIDELQTDYLNQFGLSIRINPNYIFNGWKNRWLAVYERSSQQILNGIISIAINYPCLYSEMCKRRIDKDKFNIEAQAKITVGHEIGHGLVDYIKRMNLKPSELKELPNLAIIVKCGARKEETLVEEFGQYQFPEATSMWDSVLADALEELQSMS